ncbi:MAG: hypothetical protein ABI036_11895, partial [Fibrobacteria bacterium]
VPGIKTFRAPSMMLFWLATALLMMSADALSRLTGPNAQRDIPADKRKRWGKRLWQAGFAVSGLMVVAGVAPDIFLNLWDSFFGAGGGAEAGNLANRVNDHSALALGFIRGGVLLAVLVYAARKWLLDEVDPKRFGLALLAVTCVDLMWVNSNFIKVYDPARNLGQEPAVAFLKADTSSFRVFGLPGTYERSIMQYHLIETADGWTDNEYRLYREYRGGDYQNNPNLMAGLKQNPDGSVSGSNFLDMLNVKYLAYRLQGEGGMRLAPNTSALPRAWFVAGWKSEPDTVALEKMKRLDFNPRNLAYVSSSTPLPQGFAADMPPATSAATVAPQTPGDTATAVRDSAATPAPPPAQASIVRSDKTYNHLSYTVENAKPGIFILSELWFPHWHLQVDGKEATLLRADFAFRGAALEAGKHEVVLTYGSPWIRTGFVVAGLSLFALAGGLFIIARFGRPSEAKA